MKNYELATQQALIEKSEFPKEIELPLLLKHLQFDFTRSITIRINPQTTISIAPPVRVVEQLLRGELKESFSWLLIRKYNNSVQSIEMFPVATKQKNTFHFYAIRTTGTCIASGKAVVEKDKVILEVIFPFFNKKGGKSILTGSFDNNFNWRFERKR